MDITKIPAGLNPPEDIYAVIEIPQGGLPVKYELDKASGALRPIRRPLPAYLDDLSGQVRLRAAYPVAGR